MTKYEIFVVVTFPKPEHVVFPHREKSQAIPLTDHIPVDKIQQATPCQSSCVILQEVFIIVCLLALT